MSTAGPARRAPRHRSVDPTALVALPVTATDRSSAQQVALLFAAWAGLGLLVCLLPGQGVDVPLMLAVGTGFGVVAAVVAATRRLRRWQLHTCLLLASAVAALVVLDARGSPLALAYSCGFLTLTIVAISTCSWAGASPHVLLALVGPLLPAITGDGDAWASATIVSGLIALTTLYAGFMVRAAARAEVDALTGVPNRRGADRRLDQLSALATTGSPAAVALVDLDHFKQVNDSRGHAAGDALLRAVARGLRAGVPAPGCVTRWGGDEFLVLAATAPERLADHLEVARRLLPDGASFSAGVTGLVPGEGPSATTSRADAALYAVKRSRRGTTEVASVRETGALVLTGPETAGHDATRQQGP
ncbi:GGDEF domain-containing protein [Pseudokineococcus basanitobsidens]|uniref:GGDEF domain-containing protein n=1 Tax=Pseudokineococcus basanitobsidens TaxID=1926649 RepID=A0ABU8RG57_9ACTN